MSEEGYTLCKYLGELQSSQAERLKKENNMYNLNIGDYNYDAC